MTIQLTIPMTVQLTIQMAIQLTIYIVQSSLPVGVFLFIDNCLLFIQLSK